MLPPPDAALAHYSDRQSLVSAGAEVAAQMWAEVNPASIVESWTMQVPELTAVLSGAQLGAARQADPYLDEVAAWQEVDTATASLVDAKSFAGIASDGRGLMSLLMSPAFSALQVIGSGLASRQALSLGGQHLDTIARTQVADAGRLADGVSLAAHTGLDGYVRVVVGKTCSRCITLAGRKYKWNAGFQRHPHCDCVHLPCQLAEAGGLVQNPAKIYRSMTDRERTAAGWSRADQQALADGADIGQITNAHRGVYTAGGRKFTTEGTTKRGLAGSRLGKRTARLTPEQIYLEAGADRDAALRLLYDHGYLVNEPAIVRRAEGAHIARPGLGPTAAELAADPALKMTIADLKAIAKDNGVPLFGATKKRDIISTIRQWESDKIKSGGKVLLPDGPIGKPITFKPEPIVAPPLGVPPASQRALSGDALNDWADHFKYDQQYARHEFVNAAGDTAAEGVRVKDLRTSLGDRAEGVGEYVVRTGTAWRFDGVAYLIEHGEADFGAPWVSRALQDLRAAHEAIPAAARANQSYAVLSGRNPGDSYWARRFNNPNHTAAASAGNGHINIWRFQPTSRINVDVLRHETGHNLDDIVARTAHGSASPEWASAADADAISAARIRELKSDPYADIKAEVDPARGFAKGVTGYGKSSAAEDYAESVMLYQQGEIAFGQAVGEAAARRLYFRDVYPERAKILDAQFPEIAKAQQRAIADLKKAKATAPPVAPVADVSKLNVTQLRALAKERGIKVPSKALKADIVALFEPPKVVTGTAKRAAARVRQAEIERRTQVADLLAEVDDLIAKKAEQAVFIQRLDHAIATGVDAATVATLRRALGDTTKLRAAMTRVGTKHGIKGVGRAGQKVKFDAALHEPVGAAPKAGAQVVVTRRGTTLNLNGETIELSKAQVSTVVAPVKAAKPAPISEPKVGRSVLNAGQLDLTGVGNVPGVTAAERKAVDLYANDAQRINALIRAGRTGSATIRNLDRLLGRSTVNSDVELWRGLRSGEGQFGRRLAGDLTGAEFDEAAYLSTSANRQVAAEFAGSFGDPQPIIMRLIAPRNTHAVTISDWGTGHAIGGQAEVLLSRGMRLRVIADRGVQAEAGIPQGARILDVEIVPTGPKSPA